MVTDSELKVLETEIRKQRALIVWLSRLIEDLKGELEENRRLRRGNGFPTLRSVPCLEGLSAWASAGWWLPLVA